MEKKGNLLYAAIYLLTVIIIGVLGFYLIEGYPFIDALYMTVITTSTVGFREVYPLSDTGKLFTIFLIFASIGVLAWFVSNFTQSLFQRQMRFFIPGYYKKLKFKKMENHVIVCGYGRNGSQVVKELQAYGEKVVVIDQNHDLVLSHMGESIRIVEGDATEDSTLVKADIATAKALITTLPNDADNLFVVITARALNPKMNIISRASNESSEKKLRMAGVDSVVMPEQVGGSHMATLIAQPDVVEFMEHLNIHGSSPVQLTQIECAELPPELTNKPIKDLSFRKITGANIIGYKTAQGEYILNPSPDTKLFSHTKLFVLGTEEQIKILKDYLSGRIKFNGDPAEKKT